MNSPQDVWAPRADGARVVLADLMNAQARDVRSSYSDREAMLYALSIGWGVTCTTRKSFPSSSNMVA